MKTTLRCAIYTRKSTDEGLDQAFNSLDAQREACEAYVLSQKHEGWSAISHHYDDGGFSGGNMDRPALGKLLADIKAGKVNVVVVYKVDRLTRSLSDFAKIVEQFDSHGVSFVSVTQQFNTTTSMGRLTLNVLLSFAQFEREVAGERIRDKIAASKKKGMWMGGTVPLGYKAEGKELIVVKEEAKLVELIYTRYLELRTVQAVEAELKDKNIRSRTGSFFSRGALYQILNSPVYLGKVRHKGQLYDGQHAALLTEVLWQKVQQKLQQQGVPNYSRKSRLPAALLTGLLFTADGARLVPTHANKQGKRYRYYYDAAASHRKQKQAIRIPAAEIERVMIGQLCKELNEVEGTTELKKQIQSADQAVQRAAIEQLVMRVDILNKSIRIKFKKINKHLPEELNVPYQMRILQSGSKVLSSGQASMEEKERQQNMLKAIVRGHIWRDRLLKTPDMTLAKLMKEEGIKGPYLMELINLTFLAPDILEGILQGNVPLDLDIHKVARKLPLSWSEQKRLLA